MGPVRRILAQRPLGLIVCVAALLLKLLVPAGMMVAPERGRIAVMPCPGVVAAHAGAGAAQAGMADHRRSGRDDAPDAPCAFAVLAAAMLAAAMIVAGAPRIGPAAAHGVQGARAPPPAGPRSLRPPPRGPPPAR